MNTNWERAIEFVLKEEGGYTVDEHDNGGETNFGISKRSYPNVDIKNLTVEEAKEIYQQDFWHACHCDELPAGLDIAMFDAAVNQGTGGAIRCLQIALGNLTVDGIMGDATKEAAFKASPTITRRFMAQRMVRYIRIIMKDNTQEVFADNWSNRLMRLAQIVFVPAAA